jgi:hypothetical protein
MVFDYYKRLSARQQSIYRQSDAITRMQLPEPAAIQPLVPLLEAELAAGQPRRIQAVAQRVADALVAQLKAPPLRIQVLAVRPSDDWGELHGLYIPEEGRKPAKIQLWMRTAKHKRVVAFRSFLRTLLHELCHHFDYELFGFPETFHTEGFYNRESSLFHQLVPGARAARQERSARDTED